MIDSFFTAEFLDGLGEAGNINGGISDKRRADFLKKLLEPLSGYQPALQHCAGIQ
ncbi:MAG: hypothetical protein WCH98_00185 [Verrucomicrobiota bacterium]